MNVPLIILCYTALFLLGFIDNSRGPIFPSLISQFNLTQAQASIVFWMASLSSFVVAILSKWWLKKIGAMGASRLAIFLMAIAVFSMGFTATERYPFSLFVTASSVFGISVGFLSLSLNILIAEGIDLLHRQKVYAGLHSMYGMASLIAPLILSFMFKFGVSWQNYFMVCAAFPLVLMSYSFRFKASPIQKDESKNREQALAPKLALKLGLLFSCYVATEVLVSSRMVIYLMEQWQLTQESASLYLSVFFLLLLFGRLSFGLTRIPFALSHMLKISILFTLVFYLMGLYIHPYFLVMTGLSMSYFFPCGMTWLSIEYQKQSSALIAVVMTFVGGMIVLMHALSGVIADTYGVQTAMFIGPVMLIFVLYFLHSKR